MRCPLCNSDMQNLHQTVESAMWHEKLFQDKLVCPVCGTLVILGKVEYNQNNILSRDNKE